MSESLYCLVFEGKISSGQDLAEVKKRLQKVFKKDAQTIEKLFSGRKVKLKQGLSAEQALQFKTKMQSIGAVCDVEPQSAKPQSIKSQSGKNSSAPAIATTAAGVAASPASQSNSRPAPNSMPSAVGSPMVANVSQPPPQATGKNLKLADIDKSFKGMIQAVDIPATFKVGVIATAVAMVMLPLIYVGLIAMLGYGVVISHGIGNASWLSSGAGAIGYVLTLLVGVTVTAFLVKPLVAPPASRSQKISLDPIKEPIIYHFANKVALAVGAPRPKQIELDCEVDASVSFRKGLFSFVGDDLVLTLGMPLLAGLNTRQLAGVLAHEFGHFSPSVGMRFHYLTYKVNNWFFNAVNGHDRWDEKLDGLASKSSKNLAIVFNFVRGGFWLTRKVLFVFMKAGQLLSNHMLRKMELDADRFQIQVAGSEQFRNTTVQQQRLSVACHVSHDYLEQAWENKKLVNDFPALVAHNAAQMPEKLDKALVRQMAEANAQIYDAHPSDNERIENAANQQAKGVCTLESPSHELFKRFDLLSKQISQEYYADELGLDFDPSKLVDINQVVKIAQDNEAQQEAYHAYFKDMAPVFDMPLSVNVFDTGKDEWSDLLAQYRNVENQLADQIASRRMLVKKAEESSVRFQVFQAINDLEEAGFILFPEWFDINSETLEANKKHLAMYEQTWQQTMEQLRPMFEINDRRLSIALTLLNHPKMLEADFEHAQHLKTRNRFSLLVNNIKRHAPTVVDVRLKLLRLASFLSCVPATGQKPADMPAMRDKLLEELKQSLQQMMMALGQLDYPYVPEGEHQTIAEFLEPQLPRSNQFSTDHEYYITCSNLVLEKLDAVYGRIISGLANVALTVDRLIPVLAGKAPMPQKVVEPEPVPEPVAPPKPAAVEQFANIKRSTFAIDDSEPEPESAMIANKGDKPAAPEMKEEVKAEEPVEQQKAGEAIKREEVAKGEEVKQSKQPDNAVTSETASFTLDTAKPEAEKVAAVQTEQKEQPAQKPAEKPATTRPEPVQPQTDTRAAINFTKPAESVSNTASDDKQESEKPAFAVKQDKAAGTVSTFSIDQSEPETTTRPEQSKASVFKLPTAESKSGETGIDANAVSPVTDKQAGDTTTTKDFTAGKSPLSLTVEGSSQSVEGSKQVVEDSKQPIEGSDQKEKADYNVKPAIASTEESSKFAQEAKDTGEPVSDSLADSNKQETEQSSELSLEPVAESATQPPAIQDQLTTLETDDSENQQSDNKESEEAASFSPEKNEPAVPAEPPTPKSSNPFLSRSPFAPKQDDDLTVASAPTSTNSPESEPVKEEQPQSVVAKTPNPFLANVKTYQEKLAREKAAAEEAEKTRQGSTISMDGLNAGSMPASMSAARVEKPEDRTEEPVTQQSSSVSASGLSLEPQASADMKKETTDSSLEANEEAQKPDPESVVVEKPAVLSALDKSKVSANSKEQPKKFFESPGLPNSSPAEERGLRPEPPTDLFKAFGSDTSEDGHGESEAKSDASSNESDSDVGPAANRSANH